MLRLIFSSLLLAAVMAAPQEDLSLEEEWSDFKVGFNKQYTSMEEELNRMEIFDWNLKMITTHNKEANDGVHSYWLGVNQLADMTREEIVKMMNGYKMAPERNSIDVYPEWNVDDSLPSEVDWRTEGYVTPIKNQGNCGSCWAFSTTGSLEGQHFKQTGNLTSLSEQNLVDCSRPEGNLGCAGGLMDQAFEYIQKNGGIDTEASYPYTATDDKKCQYTPATKGATDVGFQDVIPHGNEMALQSAVASVGPVSVAIDASQSTFHFYKKGVYYDPNCSSVRLDHGVLAVGYGVESPEDADDYWMVKNSWGEVWGMEGYIKMSRNKKNNCGIATEASYPKV